jgi:hypothetical protein
MNASTPTRSLPLPSSCVDGFAFLHRRCEAGLDDGPILVAVEDHRIVGAIGPLSTMLDALGRR